MKIIRNGDETELAFSADSPVFVAGIHAYDSTVHPRFLAWVNKHAKTIAIMGGRHHIHMILTFAPEVQADADNYFTLVRIAGLQAINTYEE